MIPETGIGIEDIEMTIVIEVRKEGKGTEKIVTTEMTEEIEGGKTEITIYTVWFTGPKKIPFFSCLPRTELLTEIITTCLNLLWSLWSTAGRELAKDFGPGVM
jgi:hypothetical protein